MLTPNDLVLLREALVCWSRETHGVDRILKFVDTENPIEVTSNDVTRLLDLLRRESMRYIVVDSESNHAVNTRLFKNMPTIHPSSGRWQVRSVIG